MNNRTQKIYIRNLSKRVERHKIHQVNKRWILAGMSFLVATGLAVVGNSLNTNVASASHRVRTSRQARVRHHAKHYGDSNILNRKHHQSTRKHKSHKKAKHAKHVKHAKHAKHTNKHAKNKKNKRHVKYNKNHKRNGKAVRRNRKHNVHANRRNNHKRHSIKRNRKIHAKRQHNRKRRRKINRNPNYSPNTYEGDSQIVTGITSGSKKSVSSASQKLSRSASANSSSYSSAYQALTNQAKDLLSAEDDNRYALASNINKAKSEAILAHPTTASESAADDVKSMATSASNQASEELSYAMDILEAQANQKAKPSSGHGKIRKIDSADELDIGQNGYLKGVYVKRLDPKGHYRWFMINQHNVGLHKNLLSVGHHNNIVGYLPKKHDIYKRIQKIFKVSPKNHRRGHRNHKRNSRIRYEVKFNHRRRFITGNHHYVKNAYWQKRDFGKHKHLTIKVISPCAEYKSRYYTKKTLIKGLRPGKKLTVKRMIRIGRKGDYQTRFILTNGHYVTANRNYTKIVK